MTANAGINHRDRLYRDHFRTRVRQTEHELAAAGFDRLLIHSGRSHARFQDDYHPSFRAHGHFAAWLPLPHHAECLLEVRPGRTPGLWLWQPEDFWHAPPSAPEPWWADHYDLRTVAEPSEWQPELNESVATALIGDPRDFGTLGRHAELNPPKLVARLDEARTVKTDWEVACVAEANRIAVTGHKAAGRAFEAGESELGIHLAYLEAAGHDPDLLPYPSIVCLNEHAAILHNHNRDRAAPDAHRSFLIDAGADCHGYAADITRTWAGSDAGLFGELIEAMDAMQRHLAGRMQTGREYTDLNLEAHRGVAEILHGHGLCDMSLDAMLEANVTSTFLPHGLGHFLGVQVHDVAGLTAPDGRDLPAPSQYPALRLTRVLEAGNLLTVEPGLYFIPALLEPLRQSPLSRHLNWDRIEQLVPFGGIRIEDNVVVALEQPRNLTREAWEEN